MKFLKVPQSQIDENGNRILYLITELGDMYYLKEYQTWKNAGIAQEPGGNYNILDEDGNGREFIYKKIQFINEYLIAYFRREMNEKIYIHIYDKNGKIVRFDWEDEGHGFICIWESETRYFIDSRKQKAYSKYHPKYWVKRLH